MLYGVENTGTPLAVDLFFLSKVVVPSLNKASFLVLLAMLMALFKTDSQYPLFLKRSFLFQDST